MSIHVPTHPLSLRRHPIHRVCSSSEGLSTAKNRRMTSTGQRTVFFFFFYEHAMTRRPFLRWTSLFAAVGGGAYYYQKNQNYQAPTIPYVPPPFLWETIPAQIAERFTVPHPVKDGFLWNMASRCVMGVTGLLAKGFLMSNQTRVYGLDSFMAILDDPERTRGVITGKE